MCSENSVVADHEFMIKLKKNSRKWNGYFLNKDEIKKFEQHFIDPKRVPLCGPVAGKSAYDIAKLCGVDVPKDTKVIIAEYQGVG